ncbi:eukaryotic translation initiation factor 3 subunit G-domain-containing protein [Lentinula raphanica]|uniref:Eukaryotic translation initiation factor 3 subunit G n=1 Tax=Lentinula raphanica TaxID=153919 RepID=A0AA38P3F6_9AGAR|nr:translation initiation factor eIF3g [Lentinula raphanica]KAJ3776615.1 eukaryotic translation initiation factor 3 subunit G-domain-containing protein [Lentinula raphanica]KAJ3835465.1 eukaryotic translation initiation factor 3 subunit G-domain-containing protein [Lentinula raphanica]
MSIPKTSWADDVDELVSGGQEDENVRTMVEYSVNEQGKKVKITRKIKRTLQKSVVEHQVAERQKWAKFGAEKGNARGPDRATTTVGENVYLTLSAGNKAAEAEQQEEKKPIKSTTGGKVVCRLCKGDHFTAKCPYKDTLGPLEGSGDTGAGPDDDTIPPPDVAPGAGPTGSKYIPPSLRAGARGAGETMRGPGGGSRDDLPTLRVTNISEDTQEADLRDLFGHFGRVARVYVGRDRETGAGKGFAFVSFEDRAVAQKAMEKVNGKGYDNLILSVQWSQPRTDPK